MIFELGPDQIKVTQEESSLFILSVPQEALCPENHCGKVEKKGNSIKHDIKN